MILVLSMWNVENMANKVFNTYDDNQILTINLFQFSGEKNEKGKKITQTILWMQFEFDHSPHLIHSFWIIPFKWIFAQLKKYKFFSR